jgi:hypothetical protein
LATGQNGSQKIVHSFVCPNCATVIETEEPHSCAWFDARLRLELAERAKARSKILKILHSPLDPHCGPNRAAFTPSVPCIAVFRITLAAE